MNLSMEWLATDYQTEGPCFWEKVHSRGQQTGTKAEKAGTEQVTEDETTISAIRSIQKRKLMCRLMQEDCRRKQSVGKMEEKGHTGLLGL